MTTTTKTTGRMQTHTVAGGGGLQLHVREWGKADGPPILFIHGWSQNHLCWDKQYESALPDEFRLVAYDLRGHGMSDAPPGPGTTPTTSSGPTTWRRSSIELGLERAVLVGWSYGSLVICDYIRAYGQDRVAAINFVEGAVKLGEAAFGTLIGPVPRPLRRTPPPTTCRPISAAMRGFVRACLAKPVPAEDFETALCWNMAVATADPRHPRRARDRRRRRAARPRGAAAGYPGPFGHGGAPGDGRTRPGHLPDRRGLLVRRRWPRAAPGGARPLQPRAGRADPACLRLIGVVALRG